MQFDRFGCEKGYQSKSKDLDRKRGTNMKKLKVCPYCGHDLTHIEDNNCPLVGSICNSATNLNGVFRCHLGKEAYVKIYKTCDTLDSGI